MKEQLQDRLETLKEEFQSGQKMIADLEVKRANMSNTLLRISGAMQVLEEELAKERELGGNGGKEPIVQEESVTLEN